jgi:arginyl-tRNA synthetase
MRSTIRELQEVFTASIRRALPAVDVPAMMAVCAGGAAKGHYQCNSAMSIFQKLKGTPDAPKNPKMVGDAIVAQLPADHPMIARAEVAGPGFINVFLREEFLTSFMSNLLVDGKIPAPLQPRRLRCVVDFSSPNIAKEMHGA